MDKLRWSLNKSQPVSDLPRITHYYSEFILRRPLPVGSHPTGDTPTFTRRFNNYELLYGLMYVHTRVCI